MSTSEIACSAELQEADGIRADFQIEMFFDGDCPLCVREKNLLNRMDRHNRILFTDITAPNFVASDYGKTQDDFMAEMHGRLPDGQWVTGVEVFRRLYEAVGFRVPVLVTRLPVIRHLLDAAYAVFARNRLKLTGRCQANCQISSQNRKATES